MPSATEAFSLDSNGKAGIGRSAAPGARCCCSARVSSSMRPCPPRRWRRTNAARRRPAAARVTCPPAQQSLCDRHQLRRRSRGSHRRPRARTSASPTPSRSPRSPPASTCASRAGTHRPARHHRPAAADGVNINTSTGTVYAGARQVSTTGNDRAAASTPTARTAPPSSSTTSPPPANISPGIEATVTGPTALEGRPDAQRDRRHDHHRRQL